MIVSIIIPVFNEGQHIDEVLEQVLSIQFPPGLSKEIIVINDGSFDETPLKLSKYQTHNNIKIFHHPNNCGKAAAMRLGFAQATGDIFLVQDADLEYSPDDYLKLIEPILKKKAAVVYGSRFKGEKCQMPFINICANWLATKTFNIFFRASITDVNTCYKVYTREIIQGIHLAFDQFCFDIELAAQT